MTRKRFRAVLWMALALSCAFAAWTWFRPYAWSADPNARCRIEETQVKRDRSNYWVDVHLKVLPGRKHDLMKPVRLLTAGGRELEPADTTLGGESDGGINELWFKFWLEKQDMRGALTLRINDGSLIVRSGTGAPSMGVSNVRNFTSHSW